MQISYQPFIKWVGGKRSLLPQIVPHIPKSFNSYHEPFLGGGAVFFQLVSQGKLQDKKAYLYDLNSELINTYKIVRDAPLDLIKKLREFESNHSKEFYYNIRNLDRKIDFLNLEPIYRAARFIYLNKTCYNGLYRVNRNNQNNVPIGRYKDPKICDSDSILSASKALYGLDLINSSYKEVLNYAKSGDFVYFDPPYFPISKSSNFTAYSKDSFDKNSQIELFETFCSLAQKGVKVLQSNSYSDFIVELYKDFEIIEIFANRSINSKATKRGKISEVLIRSNQI